MTQVLSPGALPDPVPMKKEEEEEEWHENLNVRLICKDCREDPPELYEDHASGDLICANCGLVLQQRSIDQSSEWRTFSNDDQGNDDPSRVGDGPNALLNGAQLETGIAYDGGMRGKELHRAQNKAIQHKGNMALNAVYKQIGTACETWELPSSVIETAKHIYKTIHDADVKVFKGKSQEVLVAGCVFFACRRNGVARTFREVMDLTKVSKKEIGRTFKALEVFIKNQAQEAARKNRDAKAKAERNGTTGTVETGETSSTLLGDLPVNDDQQKEPPSTSPSDLCARFCYQLKLNQRTTNVATALATSMSHAGALAGRSPLSSAAACIYMAGHLMDQAKTAKQIMEVAKVSDSTIRQAYKLLYQVRDKLIGEDILARGADVSRLPRPA